MKISLKERQSDQHKQLLYERLSRVCYKMHDCCNNPKQKCYKNYGGRGVTYCKKWSTAQGFIDDADKIPNWNEDKFMKHQLQLDKDYKNPNSKEYSLQNCIWIDKFTNSQLQPSRQKPFTAYNLETGQYKHGRMKTKFARDNDISYSTFIDMLKHKKHRSGAWVAWYDDDQNKPDINDPIYKKYRNYGKHSIKL